MRQFIVVAEVNKGDLKEGDEFRSTRWPLHMTIIPWFYADEDKAIEYLRRVHDEIDVLKGVVGEEAMFGKNQDLKVSKIIGESIHDLHHKALGILKDMYLELVDDRFVGGDYRPHITHQVGQDTPVSDTIVTFTGLSLLEKTKINDKSFRKVKELLNF